MSCRGQVGRGGGVEGFSVRGALGSSDRTEVSCREHGRGRGGGEEETSPRTGNEGTRDWE